MVACKVVIQMAVTDAQIIVPLLFRELFWSPPCVRFTEMKPLEYFIGRTVTNLLFFATSSAVVISVVEN
jgi:hypothetical protein